MKTTTLVILVCLLQPQKSSVTSLHNPITVSICENFKVNLEKKIEKVELNFFNVQLLLFFFWIVEWIKLYFGREIMRAMKLWQPVYSNFSVIAKVLTVNYREYGWFFVFSSFDIRCSHRGYRLIIVFRVHSLVPSHPTSIFHLRE